ncbi:MAG TPA: glutamate racemase [Rugosibacter sp.]|nr:glutamate racemase [Rugosibacter sp.]HQN45483.1 glutamate racemase [Rugosibacter sp.]
MIGVFDSGLGGLSVLAALIEALPRADFVYFADSAHVPYGDKSETYIQARVLAIGAELIQSGCTLLVVACNTATATAVEALREKHPGIPVVGIEPGIKPAAQSSITRRIGVLATEATANSARLDALIKKHAGDVKVIVEPCPGWATQVERLDLDNIADIRQHVWPLLDQGVDRLVLGCTHYSFLTPMLREAIDAYPAVKQISACAQSNPVMLIDVADAVARQTQRLAGSLAHGHSRLVLRASAHPEKLHAALPRLHLSHLVARASDSSTPSHSSP